MDSTESVSSTEPFPHLLPPIPEGQPNEQPPEIENQAEASRFKKLVSATAGVFEKAGARFKKGPGRPRKDGQPGKLDLPLNAPATALPASAAPVPADDSPHFDSALVKRCCSAVVKGFSGVMDKILFKKATAFGYKPAEAQQLICDTAITAEELSSFSELAEICLRKYGVDTAYVPEIGLACIVIGVGARYAVAIKSLQKPEPQTPENNGQ